MEYNNKPYDNFKMLSKDGIFLAYTNLKRKNWYLKRDLAVMVDDIIYQLNFETDGNGNEDRHDYFKVKLDNRCVVCGNTEELTRHHVVPSQYRKLLPLHYKESNSFDIVSICNTCHTNYEKEANKLKSIILHQYGLESYTKHTLSLRKARSALMGFSDVLSEERKERYTKILIDEYDMPLEKIYEIDPFTFKNVNELLFEKIENIDNFIIMWRKHFLSVSQPKFISDEWIDGIEKVFTK